MNDKYKKKYLKYKKKYLQFKQLRGGTDEMDEEIDLKLEIDLAGGLFFALSSSLFLDKFSLQPGVDYSLKIKDITDYFNAELGKMKAWHTSTAGRTKTGGREERAEILGFPWNNEQTMIQIFGEKFSVLSNAKILELLIDECNEIGDLDTKLHMNLSDEDIIGALSSQEFPSYAAMFFLAREKCGDFNIDEILAFLKKKGEKTDLGASVLDRTFLSKLIHSNKVVLEKIRWELIFIILKNEPGKIEKRMRRFIIFYFIFEKNKNIFTINSIDQLLDMCISHQSSNNWDTVFPSMWGKPPPALLSTTTLETQKNAQVDVINTTVAKLDAFDRTNTESGERGWARWEALKKQNFPHIFPEILDSTAEDFIRKKLEPTLATFAIDGFTWIKRLIKDQTTLNSLLLTSFNGFGGNGLPYQNLAENIKIILAKMKKFLKEGGSTVPTVQLIPLNFTNKAHHISIARAIKNVIINLATDHDGADVGHGALFLGSDWVPYKDPGDGQIKWENTVTRQTSAAEPSVKWIGPYTDPKDGQTKWKNKETGKETIQKPIASMVNLSKYMKEFYIKHLNLTEPIKGPSGFSWARVQVPMNLGNITPELMEEIALLKLSINKLTTKNPPRRNITDDQVVEVLTEIGYRIPDRSHMSQELVQTLATLKDKIIQEELQTASQTLISFLRITETRAAQILASFQTKMEEDTDIQTVMEGDTEILMQHRDYISEIMRQEGYTDEELNTMLPLLLQVTLLGTPPEDQIAMLQQWARGGTPKKEQIEILQTMIRLGYTLNELNTMLQLLTTLGHTGEEQNTMVELLRQLTSIATTSEAQIEILLLLVEMSPRPSPAAQIKIFQHWVGTRSPTPPWQQIAILQLVLSGFYEAVATSIVPKLLSLLDTPKDLIVMLQQWARAGYTPDQQIVILQMMLLGLFEADATSIYSQLTTLGYTPEYLNTMLQQWASDGHTADDQIALLQRWVSRGRPQSSLSASSKFSEKVTGSHRSPNAP
jgi:hypothetical protein